MYGKALLVICGMCHSSRVDGLLHVSSVGLDRWVSQALPGAHGVIGGESSLCGSYRVA